MKKLLVIVLLMGALATGLYLFLSKPLEPTPPPSVAKQSQPGTPVSAPAAPAASTSAPQAKAGALFESDAYKALRAAVQAGNQGAAVDAFDNLVAFVKAHPEMVDDYVAALRTEKSEMVLRYLALALAESKEVLRDDKIARVAIELAKDNSFQQRQHIALHLMGSFPEMRDDVRQAVIEISGQDRDSQVKASAVAVLADWMETFHGETGAGLITELEQIFKTAVDADVRGFTYQLAAAHKEQLPRSFQLALVERLKTETDWTGRNIIIAALTAAPGDIRGPVLAQVQSSFDHETDLENKRNLLAQLVTLIKEDSVDLLQKAVAENSPLAEDAKAYLAIITDGTVSADTVFGQKSAIDAARIPPTEVKH